MSYISGSYKQPNSPYLISKLKPVINMAGKAAKKSLSESILHSSVNPYLENNSNYHLMSLRNSTKNRAYSLTEEGKTATAIATTAESITTTAAKASGKNLAIMTIEEASLFEKATIVAKNGFTTITDTALENAEKLKTPSTVVAQRVAINNLVNSALAQQTGQILTYRGPAWGVGSSLLGNTIYTAMITNLPPVLVENGLNDSTSGAISGAAGASLSNWTKVWNLRIVTSNPNEVKTSLDKFHLLTTMTWKDATRGMCWIAFRDSAWAAAYFPSYKYIARAITPQRIQDNPSKHYQQHLYMMPAGAISGALAAMVSTPISTVYSTKVDRKCSAKEAISIMYSRPTPITDAFLVKLNSATNKLFHLSPSTKEAMKIAASFAENTFRSLITSAKIMGIIGGVLTFGMETSAVYGRKNDFT